MIFRGIRRFSISKEIERYASYSPQPLTLKTFLDFGAAGVGIDGTERNSCIFLRTELPVRLARLLQVFDSIEPDLILQTTSAQQVRSWYLQSFEESLSSPSIQELENSESAVQKMSGTVENFFHRHTPVVITMAQAVVELKKRMAVDLHEQKDLHLSLDKFYTSRINVRMLVQQHIEMFGNQKEREKSSSMIGMIDPRCKPAAVANDAALSAKILCESIYGITPKVEIDLPTGDVEFSYIPAHLYHMLFELLKNSMRATIETHGTGRMPPVRVIIVEGEEDLTIKISDEGGGIKRSGMPYIFSYLYSTAKLPSDLSPDASNHYSSGQVPLAGFGFGLPLSRVYARYFGGDLKVISTERFGTDAYIYLKRVAAEAGEVIPKYMR